MHIFRLSEYVAVAGQITPADVAAIAAAGYRVLINNRPDGEVPNQPTNAEIATAAAAAGLEYHYLPVTAQNFPGPDAATMMSLMNDPDKPVLAFCRSGTRCTNLWIVTRPESERQLARQTAWGLGFDTSMANAY